MSRKEVIRHRTRPSTFEEVRNLETGNMWMGGETAKKAEPALETETEEGEVLSIFAVDTCASNTHGSDQNRRWRSKGVDHRLDARGR